ncbi:helix-turn-helix transcriptional regulator [Microvirga arsenatis]|uniref:Helix-turn-helix domain-containing protein n=1 Tax=Microvirga arsenatis TaxID=2692265 RepID=A0ABW9Z3F0_9HYPH|nr:helix-turn-helix transcriptional regulator [Microvirga arsenatis]NBJ13768.1 helix-turn-helix domain-containing protein [Microvirga arsenatis]NBJ27222.1 helix-turn-helix domain-containing protein [Microvirga arsenatis]
MRAVVALSTYELDALERLGQTVKLARLRRNLTQAELAERMGVSRLTVVALEKGNAGTSIGALLKALTVFGYTGRLGEILASDPIGDDLDIAEGRKRARARTDVADF